MNDRLFRSRSDRMLAGVAGGLAELWDADPSLVRLVWALLVVFTGGLALLVYIIMAIVVPEEDDDWLAAAPPPVTPASAATGPVASEAPASDAPATDAPATVPATGEPQVTPPPAPGAMWAAPPVDSRRAARMEARAARRASRAERRSAGALSGAMIGGIVLIAIGVFFLVREWLPQLDFDWFWPAVLIGLGVVVLVMAVGRKPDDPGSAS
jgi:phage shock protein PspC (stress-responsive transcriptional regulator)